MGVIVVISGTRVLAECPVYQPLFMIASVFSSYRSKPDWCKMRLVTGSDEYDTIAARR